MNFVFSKKCSVLKSARGQWSTGSTRARRSVESAIEKIKEYIMQSPVVGFTNPVATATNVLTGRG